MSSTVVLTVGLDSSPPESQPSGWQPAERIVTSAGSVRNAIACFNNGEFDIVFQNASLPADSRERPTHLIRASGSRLPVGYISDSTNNCDQSANTAIQLELANILEEMEELMASRARMPDSRAPIPRPVTWQVTAR